MASQDEPTLAIVVGTDEPACRYIPPYKLIYRLKVSSSSTNDLLTLFLLTEILYITDGLAVGDGEHEDWIAYSLTGQKRFVVVHQCEDFRTARDTERVTCHLIISSHSEDLQICLI
jgi:hypothetical protein